LDLVLAESGQIVNNSDIDRLLSIDDIFQLIREKYGDPPNWSRPQGFISLCKIILEQQVSLASANAHFLKLSEFIRDFTPQNIIRLSEEEMRFCQISRQKSQYLKALSQSIIDKKLKLNLFSNQNESEIRSQLTSINGIGNWTTDIYLMFCLQFSDIIPLGDIAIITTIKELTQAKTIEEIRLLTDKWRPLRSLATYFLWHYYLCKRNRIAI
jgi:DNA-3-methyladenine glycosylase II